MVAGNARTCLGGRGLRPSVAIRPLGVKPIDVSDVVLVAAEAMDTCITQRRDSTEVRKIGI